MTRSKYTAPHFTYVEEIDFTELNKLRAAAKPIAEKQGIKISVLPFILKALVPALRKFPRLNAHFDDEANALRVKKYFNIGVATATDAGLMVPVIKHVEHLSVMQIASEMQRLAGAARASKAAPDELKGSTFTVTSTGNLGGVLATPILNYPEVAIMGVHRVKPTPVVRDGAIVIRDIGHVSISLDHRANDGSDAAEFIAELAKYLENPGLMML
jgi:pyruvate dehydrogenase E2 component (dihydrolipoamide acetyltransferase)